MKALGSLSPSLGLHSIPIPFSPPSFTLFTRYVPASTGVHGSRLTSHRGVTPTHWGGVFVVLASWRAAGAASVWWIVMDFNSGIRWDVSGSMTVARDGQRAGPSAVPFPPLDWKRCSRALSANPQRTD